MESGIQAVFPPRPERRDERSLAPFRPESTARVRRFHESIPGYAPTPLARLDALAARLGLGSLCVKDESRRFEQNAFKVLGGSWCLALCAARRLGLEEAALRFDALLTPEAGAKLRALTFVTATDGNHGRGVAWTAARLGARSVVYMPRGSDPERLENIRALGAQAEITALRYDDAVRYAAQQAARQGWILVQDTAWEGYRDVPTEIMRGYTTMAAEAAAQLGEPATHVFLQAGVGAMAGAVTAYLCALWPERKPVVVIVEPERADCLTRTARAWDGALHPVTTPMDTIMAGLACGEPCTVAWEILRDWADCFVAVPDAAAEEGMRLLARPRGGDARLVSGESGAVTVGLVARLMTQRGLRPLRERLGLDAAARVLCFSTEGDTSRASYRRIVGETEE